MREFPCLGISQQCIAAIFGVSTIGCMWCIKTQTSPLLLHPYNSNMFVSLGIAALVGTASARSILPPVLEQDPLLHPPVRNEAYHIPTVHESAVMARRIMHLSTIGTLVSTFPGSFASSPQPLTDEGEDGQLHTAFERRPSDIAGSPIGLMEYYANCEPHGPGNPILLAIDIATPYRNHAAGSNLSMHIRWWPTQTDTYVPSLSLLPSDTGNDDDDDKIPSPHTPAALPRFSLHGRLEPISAADLLDHDVPACFMRAHPDSVLWQPGNDIHTSRYVRFVVEHVYWFGGFGDRARIGWMPIDEWRGVTVREIAEARLPGEEDEEERGSGGAWQRGSAVGGSGRGGKWSDYLNLRRFAD